MQPHSKQVQHTKRMFANAGRERVEINLAGELGKLGVHWKLKSNAEGKIISHKQNRHFYGKIFGGIQG